MQLFSNEGRGATGIAVGISLIFLCLVDSHSARAQPATVDPTFVGSVSGGAIYKIALLNDGKILIGGTFSTVNASAQQGIARLQTNGMRDPSFTTSVSYGINDFAIDASNRIVLGGEFTRVNSAPMTNLARILANGWTDESFVATANRVVDTVALQPDGHILVGGAFSQISYAFQGAPRNRITRLNSDSSDDATFAATDRGADSTVFAFAIQPDGKVLVGGAFYTFDQQLRPYLVRLNSDMTLDSAYAPNLDGFVYGLTLTSDGKALVSGAFGKVNGIDRPTLARLNTDGSLDTTFDAGLRLYGGNVYTAVFDSAGRLYIAGSFNAVHGTPRDGFARLHSDGDVDTSFHPPSTIDGYINAIAVLPNDDLIIGGTFLGYGGLFTPRIARVQGGPAAPAAPAIVRQSTNTIVRAGNDVAFIVDAIGGPRLYYQWQFNGTNLAGETRATLELNDVLPGNAGPYLVIVSNEVGTATSEPIVLTVAASAPVFTLQPTNKVALFGQTVRFSGNATGAPNPTLQWQFNSTNIPGAAAGSILTLSNVHFGHDGGYTVIASNAVGVITSAVAQLTVNAPATNAGAVDLGFVPQPGFISQSISVSAAAVQPDGKLIVAGAGRLRRLLADGSLDTTFNTNASYDASVYSIALQPDGKVVIGGSFSGVNGATHYQIARLNGDGTLDTNFNALLGYYVVRRLVVQPDGRILFASDAIASTGTGTILGRVLPDGRPDPNFKRQTVPPADGGTPPSVSVYDLALQPDGKILFASSRGFGRFLNHGALDIGFNPPTNSFFQGNVIGLQPDGKILISASRPNTNSPPLLRLNPDGSRDATFAPQFSDGLVQAVAVQPDGKILTARLLPDGIPGSAVGQVSGTAVERMNPDGSLDASYTTTTTTIGGLPRILLKPNCEIIVIGSFTSFNSYDRVGIVQLHSDPPAPPLIVRQPVSQNIAAGQTAKFSADVSSTPEPHVQWQQDGQLIPGAASQVLSILNAHSPEAGQYTLVLSNALGVVTSAPAALVVGPAPTNAGGVDADFYAGAGPNDSVYAAVEQPDGKIVIGGLFTSVNGVARNRIARLNADGSLDPTFDAGVVFGGTSLFPSVQAVALQPDGKILAAGYFTSFNGTPVNSIVRLNTDGSLDAFFSTNGLPSGANVYTLVVQRDGKILCGSDMGRRLERLNTNGTPEASFMAGGGLGFTAGQVRAIALRPDGRIIIGGSALAWQGSPKPALLRLTTNGVLEAQPQTPLLSTISTVLSVALTGNDIIAAGPFSPSVGTYLVRCDTNFNVITGAWQSLKINSSVYTLAVDSCARILAGGTMTNVNGVACRGLIRLFDDGIVDFSFTPPLFDARLRAILPLANSRLLAAGDFAEVNGTSRPGVVKLIEEASGPPIFRWEPVSGTNFMGQDILLSTAVTCPPHTTYQWQFNGANLFGQTNGNLQLRNVRAGAAGEYRLIARNDFGAITSATATITLTPAPVKPGNNDIEFYPPLVQSENMGPIALQADGQLLVVHGPSATTAPIYRYNPDGSRDNSFASSVVEPHCLVVARNGDIFVSAGGTLKKLHSNGSPDASFLPSISGGLIENTVIQPDGKVVIVGSFTTVNATQRRRVARLNTDGSLDASFDPGAGLDNTAYSVALQPDGRILVGGVFTNALNVSPRRPFLVRFNTDGTLDPSFNSGFTSNTWVFALAVMSDRRIVVGGTFAQYAGQSRTSVLRLHADGSLDSSFTAALQGTVRQLAVQRDGKVLAGGVPLRLGTNFLKAVVRLRPDGAADPDFVQAQIEWGPVGPLGISSFALDPDGKIYVSGRFTRYDGFPRFGLARLHGNPVVFAPSFNASAFSTSMYIESGRTYFLESTPTLTPPAWTVVDSVSGNNSFYTFNDPSPPPSARFYRIRVE